MDFIRDHEKGILRLSGKLDIQSCLDLETHILPFYDQPGHLILDLSECGYVSSAGIRILLKTKKQLQGLGRELILSGVGPGVLQVMEMAGLRQIFRFVHTIEEGLVHSGNPESKPAPTRNWEWEGQTWSYKFPREKSPTLVEWEHPGIIRLADLGWTVGTGWPAEPDQVGSSAPSLFVSTGHCLGFLSAPEGREADFQLIAEPQKAGLPVAKAHSVQTTALGTLSIPPHLHLNPQTISKAFVQGIGEKDEEPRALWIFFGQEPGGATLSLALETQESKGKGNATETSAETICQAHWTGLSFKLIAQPATPDPADLQHFIDSLLTFDHIQEVSEFSPEQTLEKPLVWRSFCEKTESGNQKLIRIESPEGQALDSVQRFLARQLFTDSSRLLVEALHGGFSAQTFHVTSFDRDGRKMRPTVMKTALRPLIQRESERCQAYALPYIFNNSAVVLGAEYFHDQGALRYNFVGIGGEEGKLQWLTHLYKKDPLSKLEPIFDNVFVKILKPWYGQGVPTTIHPFRDHDPTFTFFPHIYETALQELGIDAGQPLIFVPELNRVATNPYWFLRSEYPRLRDYSVEYFQGICHGDLNMQNILLDEKNNVYLIDFSETRPRSIVSDFARLEAIFMVDNAPVQCKEDMEHYVAFIREFYRGKDLSTTPNGPYSGAYAPEVSKNMGLTHRMRRYAYDSAGQDGRMLPYYLALLEWTLPIVCYTLPHWQRRLSMIIGAILCENVQSLVHSD